MEEVPAIQQAEVLCGRPCPGVSAFQIYIAVFFSLRVGLPDLDEIRKEATDGSAQRDS